MDRQQNTCIVVFPSTAEFHLLLTLHCRDHISSAAVAHSHYIEVVLPVSELVFNPLSTAFTGSVEEGCIAGTGWLWALDKDKAHSYLKSAGYSLSLCKFKAFGTYVVLSYFFGLSTSNILNHPWETKIAGLKVRFKQIVGCVVRFFTRMATSLIVILVRELNLRHNSQKPGI